MTLTETHKMDAQALALDEAKRVTAQEARCYDLRDAVNGYLLARHEARLALRRSLTAFLAA